MNSLRPKKLASGLVAGTAMLGLSTGLAVAEEMDMASTCVNSETSRAATSNGAHIVIERQGLCFDSQGNFTNWNEIFFTVDIVEGVAVWRGNSVSTYPPTATQIEAGEEGDKIFSNWRSTHGVEGPNLGQTTIWVTGGTGRFENATSAEGLVESRPTPNPPENFSRRSWVWYLPGFIVTY